MSNVFYINYSDNKCLYSLNLETKQNKKLSNYPSEVLVMEYPWIYFTYPNNSYGNYYSIVRKNVLTDQEQVIWENEFYHYQIDLEYIYINGNGGSTHIIMKDGTYCVEFKNEVDSLKYYNDAIYYRDLSSRESTDIYYWNAKNGTEKLILKNVLRYTINDSYIIYVNGEDNSIYKYCLNTQKSTLLVGIELDGRVALSIVNNNLYYKINNQLYSVDIDGQGTRIVCDLSTIVKKSVGIDFNIYRITEGWIYYNMIVITEWGVSDNEYFYLGRMKVDGSKNEIFYDAVETRKRIVWYKNNVIFVDANDGKLYRCEFDDLGYKVSMICRDSIAEFDIEKSSGNIVYSAAENEFYICIMNLDGTNKREHTRQKTDNFIVP